MRTYKVKESHLGDKPEPYDVGDPRRLSEVDAKVLIGLGLIEDPDAPASADGEDDAAKAKRMQAEGWISLDEFNALAARHEFVVEALTKERSDSADLANEIEALKASVTGLNDQVAALTTDLDGQRAQVTALTGERDGLRDQVTTLTTQRESAGEQTGTDAAKPPKK